MKINFRRVALLSTVGVLFAFLVLDLAFAWIYTTPLLYPDCQSGVPTFKAYAPKSIELETDNFSLTAWYYPTQNGKAVIVIGGLGSSAAVALPPTQALLEGGYGVLVIPSRACGDPPQKVTLGYQEIEEIFAAYTVLQTELNILPENIGVYGFSMGGAAAIRAAALEEDISAIIAEGGFYNLGRDIVEPGSGENIIKKAYLFTVSGVYGLRAGYNPWRNSPIDVIADISPGAVLLIYGEHEAVSGRAKAQYEAAGEPKELWIVPGGDHGTNHTVDPMGYNERVVRFFEEALGN